MKFDFIRQGNCNVTANGVVLLVVMGLTTMFGTAIGADWGRYRGATGDGMAAKEVPYVTSWSPTENVLWQVELQGRGSASPIVYKDRIFLSSFSGYGQDNKDAGDEKDLKLHVSCYDRVNGRHIWTKEVVTHLPEQAFRGFMLLHGYATPSAAVDSTAVYFSFGHHGVFAFDHDGKQLWTANIGSKTHGWGYSSSPVLFENVVIFSASVESDAIYGFDKKTGEQLWVYQGVPKSWSTPLIVKSPSGRNELIQAAEKKIFALDPLTGKELWTCDGVEDYMCASPIEKDGIVYVTGGRTKKTLAVKTGGNGDVTATHIVWQNKEGSKVGTPVIHDGILYYIDEFGAAVAVNAADGSVLYKEKLELQGEGREHVYSSYMLADGKLYNHSRFDGALVLALGKEFKLLAQNRLDDSQTNAVITPDAGRLLIRTNKSLYCIGTAVTP